MPSTEPYLTFEAPGHAFAIAASAVVEVRRYEDAGEIARADVSGVLGGRPTEVGPHTCVIVVTVGGRQTGLIVDEATDFVSLGARDLIARPDFGPRFDVPYLAALARLGDGLSIVLDIDRLLRTV